MSKYEEDMYGPLRGLIGSWKGGKGLDLAPEPDGTEHNPYYETITCSAIGDVTNAESQTLAVLHYRQIVLRKSNDKVFHDQTGYWMWDAQAGLIMYSLTIPRAVSVLAGGNHTGVLSQTGGLILEVAAGEDDPDWQIIQSPFMQNNARTQGFELKITLGNNTLSYAQTTLLDIYGKVFKHTDENQLLRQ